MVARRLSLVAFAFAFAFALVLAACAGDELPPPSSASDPANPRAPEPHFDPGPNVLASSAAASSAAPPSSAKPHAGQAMPMQEQKK